MSCSVPGARSGRPFILHQVVLLIWGLTGLFCLIQAQTSAVCAIRSLIGDVKVGRGDVSILREARVGMSLRPADVVRTAAESEAVIATSDGSLIKLGEESVLRISELSVLPDNAFGNKMHIFYGDVLCDIKKMASTQSRFEFETPTAVAAIRGTRVRFVVTKERTNVRVYRGNVFVKARNAREGLILAELRSVTVDEATTHAQAESFRPSARELEEIEAIFAATAANIEPDTLAPVDTAPEPQVAEPCSLFVRQPTEGLVIRDTVVKVSGIAVGARSATGLLNAQDKTAESRTFEISIPPNGLFVHELALGSEEAVYTLTVTVQCEPGARTVNRTFTAQPPCSGIPVLLGPSIKSGELCFRVTDCTRNDQITFWSSIDGVKSSREGEPGSQFCFPLKDGVHDYVVYAEDVDGNMSRKWNEKRPHMSVKEWRIKMLRPTHEGQVNLFGGSGTDDSRAPYQVSFAIENLPVQDARLLSSVEIENLDTRQHKKEVPPAAIEFAFEINVRPGLNRIEIRVQDVNGMQEAKTVRVTAK